MRYSILLIEDDQWLAESYVNALVGHDTVIVHSGQAAMDALDDRTFDVVIADVMIEDGSVIDLLHELQSHDDTMSTPVIVCSGLASSLRLSDLRAYGVVALLDKSTVTPETLRIAVQQAIHTTGEL